uniref:Proteoglycan 4b n=1 Tax=Periophthalmus magnuspinnatus TaxID=409849 RepID=A0A3B3ZHT9_9GOBI
MNENPTSGTTAPPLPPSEIPETTSLTPESKESTTPSSTTILPTTANKETTSTPEITTKSSNPATLAPASEVDTSTVKIPAETQNPTSVPTSKPDTEQPISENPLKPDPDSDKNQEEVDTSTVKVPDETQTSTIAPTSKPDTEKPSPEKPLKPVLDSDKNPEKRDTSPDKVPDVTQSSTVAPTSKPDLEKPSLVKPLIPVLDSDNKPVLNGLGDSSEYPAGKRENNLCHYFWVLDRDRVPGPAQSISHVWGVQSPIDTVFTRCNCQGKTYIFKGPQYWRYENDVLDPGFPKLVTAGFDGLRGHVTAALSVPQYRRRGESVYFFKRGGNVQKYSYQFGTNPSCDRRVHLAVYSHRNRVARQAPAHVSLGPSINYRTSWRGFPATITAAVSIPNKREPEGYNYYVFSKSKSYKIRIEGDRPVIATAKPNASPQSNEVFKCPKKVSTSQ